MSGNDDDGQPTVNGVQFSPIESEEMESPPMSSGSSDFLKVELGFTELPFGDLAILEVGDSIQLDQKITRPLKVKVNERVKFLGRPGVRDKKMSVQITKVLQEGDEELDEQ